MWSGGVYTASTGALEFKVSKTLLKSCAFSNFSKTHLTFEMLNAQQYSCLSSLNYLGGTDYISQQCLASVNTERMNNMPGMCSILEIKRVSSPQSQKETSYHLLTMQIVPVSSAKVLRFPPHLCHQPHMILSEVDFPEHCSGN